MTVLRKETHRLQLSMERYTCDDMTSFTYEDLDQLEQKLEQSVNKIRDRKVISHETQVTILFSLFSSLYVFISIRLGSVIFVPFKH